MRILRLDHVQIAIPPGGEERARAFYGGTLGLEEIPKPAALAAGGLWFELAGGQVHLGIEPDFRPARKAHVAFAVLDLDAVRRALAEVGAPERAAAEVEGRRRFHTEDPFGNRIEIVEGARE